MIAWKASARRDRLMTKELESEVPVRCTLFVDASSSVRVGPVGTQRPGSAGGNRGGRDPGQRGGARPDRPVPFRRERRRSYGAARRGTRHLLELTNSSPTPPTWLPAPTTSRSAGSCRSPMAPCRTCTPTGWSATSISCPPGSPCGRPSPFTPCRAGAGSRAAGGPGPSPGSSRNSRKARWPSTGATAGGSPSTITASTAGASKSRRRWRSFMAWDQEAWACCWKTTSNAAATCSAFSSSTRSPALSPFTTTRDAISSLPRARLTCWPRRCWRRCCAARQ